MANSLVASASVALGEQHRHVGRLGALDEQIGELLGLGRGVADDDAARVEVVPERPALPEELRREDDLGVGMPVAHAGGEADRNGRLDDDGGLRGVRADVRDHRLDARRVEVVRLRVVVGGRGDDDEGRASVGVGRIRRRAQGQRLRREVILQLVVDDRGPALVDRLHPPAVEVEGCDLVVLGEDDGVGQAHVSEADDCDFHTDTLDGGPERGVRRKRRTGVKARPRLDAGEVPHWDGGARALWMTTLPERPGLAPSAPWMPSPEHAWPDSQGC